MKHLRAALVVTVVLFASSLAHGGGVDWYYSSFSWSGFQAYFGGGTPAQKLDYNRRLDGFVEQEKNEQFFSMQLTGPNVAAWRRFIDSGLGYESLNPQDSRFADSVLSFVMSAQRDLTDLDVQFETDPDYIHSGAFRHLLNSASPLGEAFLGLFQFGRSSGLSTGRSLCNDRGVGWNCYGAYVLLSPQECSAFAEELFAVLRAPSFKESRFEEKKYVAPMAQALTAAAKMKRGMYFYAGE